MYFPQDDLDRTISHLGETTKRFDGANIFITGGTGFIGKWIVASLLNMRDKLGTKLSMTVLTRSSRRFAETSPELALAEGVTVLDGDVRDFAMPRQDFTHIIHAATDTSQEADRNPRLLIDSIVGGTNAVLDFARERKIDDLLYVSSGAVYGPQGQHDVFRESFGGAPDPLDRRSSYGNAKRLAEQLCIAQMSQTSLKPRIARCFSFFGPGLPLDAHFAIGNFLRDALDDRPIEIQSDGTLERGYLYAGDLAVWLLRILAEGSPGQAYNVGSDEFVSLRELADRINRATGAKHDVIVHGDPNSGSIRSRYIPNVDLAKRELALDIWTSIEAGVMNWKKWIGDTTDKQGG